MRIPHFSLPLRDVDTQGSLPFDAKDATEKAARERGVPIWTFGSGFSVQSGQALRSVFAFFWGHECGRPFVRRMEQCGIHPREPDGWLLRGPLMLRLAHTHSLGFTVSVEAASVLHLLSTQPFVLPESDWYEPSWHFQSRQGMLFVAWRAGWRGAVAEYRFWLAMWWYMLGTVEDSQAYRQSIPMPGPDFQATLPAIRGWYDESLLEDFYLCVGHDATLQLLAAVARGRYKGSPDLVLWSPGRVEFAEIKSGKDLVKPEQSRCLSRLLRLGFRAAVYYTADLTAKMQAQAGLAVLDSDSEDDDD